MIHTYVYVCLSTYMYTNIYVLHKYNASIQTGVWICTYACMYVCYAYLYVNTYCVYIYIHAHTYIHICIYIYIYIHTYTYVYIYIVRTVIFSGGLGLASSELVAECSL